MRQSIGIAVVIVASLLVTSASPAPDRRWRVPAVDLYRRNGSPSGEAFMEVIVDYSAGIVLKAVPITDEGDLSAARAQKEAMDRAKRSLAEAIAAVVKANAGYRAVSATPRLDNGQPVAEVTLERGDDWKVVNARLD
jgi:hypothetical protein